jgi:thymidylate synthase (FAD)
MKPITAQELLDSDSRLVCKVVNQTVAPQYTCYIGLHQCYSESLAISDQDYSTKDESWFGRSLINNCLNHGHFSVTEHASITFNVGGFPHDVVAQITRHRHLSPSVQSGRYTSKRFTGYPQNGLNIEDLVYIRPVGRYTDREEPSYEFTQEGRIEHLKRANSAVYNYGIDLDYGMSPEHARQQLPYGVRQDFVVSGNLRAWLHFLQLRDKKDSQLEIQALAILVGNHIKEWVPEIYEFWANKGSRLKLAP